MKLTMKSKALLAAMAAASLVGCGGSSSSSGGGSGGNLSADPSFTFDQTDYVGAVDPAASSDWWDFTLNGSLPTSFAANTTVFNSDVQLADITGDWSGVTPGACPTHTGNYNIVDTGTTYTLPTQATAFHVCKLSGTILTDLTLPNDVIWQLSGTVKVGDGNRELSVDDNDVTDVTLTIQKGTVFRSEPQAFLLITRGAKIDAQGTATQPIIMWSNADDDFNTRGQWGGVVLQGFAYNNKCGNPKKNKYCNLEGEGGSQFFGGFDNADSSGTIKYMIVAEAGYEVLPDNELNGISFQGVGYGTTVDYVQVHQNDDDGMEFFGGAPNVTHMVMTSNKDDDIDWDEGFVGNLQYGITLKTTSKDNTRHAFELDTRGDAKESQFQESNPTVANFTSLSLLESAEEAAAGDGIHLKEGSEGHFYNMVFAGNFRNAVFIEDDTNLTSYSDINDAFVNVYVDGYQLNAVSNGSGSTVTAIHDATADSKSYDSFDSHIATNDDIPAVAPVIESLEVN